MEITVVDSSGVIGWIDGAVRIGEVYMTDVSSMIASVCAKAGSKSISRLNLLDHGNPDGIQIGNDWVDQRSFPKFEPLFARLRGRFAPPKTFTPTSGEVFSLAGQLVPVGGTNRYHYRGGFVHFHHCNIGSNIPLLTTFAKTFGAYVVAGTGAESIGGWNEGRYVRCFSSGAHEFGVGRPS